MKRIEIRLNETVVAPLLDFIKPIVGRLKRYLAVDTSLLDPDPELQRAWESELLTTLGEDSQTFMGLFDLNFFETGTIEISPDNAEAVLRATAAIRLKLREKYLHEIPDEVLENGDVAFESLAFEEQQGFACYLFLATIQEVILQHLDPASAS